jgi:Rad3-related DNA helicase
MDKLFDRGHDYTYLIPGLQKVVQAAGRVIRSPEDRGMLMLIDARYSWPRYQQLLPAAWGLG